MPVLTPWYFARSLPITTGPTGHGSRASVTFGLRVVDMTIGHDVYGVVPYAGGRRCHVTIVSHEVLKECQYRGTVRPDTSIRFHFRVKGLGDAVCLSVLRTLARRGSSCFT